MTTFTTRRRVPFTPQQMYALVADVERYPEFVPLCEALTVTGRDTAAPETLTAQMTFGYTSIRETIGSRVTLRPDVPEVRVNYIEGPFRYLDNRWTFHPVAGGTEIEFYISYELKSLMLQLLVGAVFEQTFRRFAEAFERRARHVYGRQPQPAL